MRYLKTIARPAIVLAALAVTMSPASAQSTMGPAGAGFSVGGIVRTICRVEVSNSSVSEGGDQVDFGNLYQLCNDRHGYRVILQHPEGMTGATFLVGGTEIPLSPGSETVIIERPGPSEISETGRLRLAGGATLTGVGFRIEPRGAVY